MSTTFAFVRPTNIGTFFKLGTLMRASLSAVSCQRFFRRNVASGKMSVARSLSADCASSSQGLSALFGRVDVAFHPLLETGIRWDNAVRRLIRADRYRTLRRTLIRCGA